MRNLKKEVPPVKLGRKARVAAGKVWVKTQIGISDQTELYSLRNGKEGDEVLIRRILKAGVTAVRSGTSYSAPAPAAGQAVSDSMLVQAASEVSKESNDRLGRRIERLEAAIGDLAGTVEKIGPVLAKLNDALTGKV